MKRKVNRWSCSNCGKALKNRLVEFCPRCNSRFSVYKANYKQLFLMAPFAILIIYIFLYFLLETNKRIGYSINTLDDFNLVMIFVSIILVVFLLVAYFFQKKRLKKSEEYRGMPINAKMEIKQFEIEVDDKLLGALIISFIIIFPVILIPAYIDITGGGVISSNPILSAVLLIVGIFVVILPFVVGYYAMGMPEKKLVEEDN